MNAALCSFWINLDRVVWLYTIVMLVYAVVSWIPDLRGRWTYYVAMLVEPVLQPVRRVVPPVGGFDLAFIIVLLALQIFVRPLIAHFALNACYL